MKVNGFACDVCEVFASNTGDWFKVTRGKTNVDVCSPECLRKLGTQLKAGGEITITEDDVPPAEQFPCEHCGRMFPSKQGLATHVTRSHKEVSA